MDIVLLGAGGSAKDMIKNIEEYNSDAASRNKKLNIIGCLDDQNKIKPGSELAGYPVLDSFGYFVKPAFRNARVICAVGDPLGKKRFVEKAAGMKLKFFNMVHPSVKLHRSTKLGIGVSIFSSSVISSFCAIGNHVSVDYLCSISHDCVIGDYVTIAPGVKIAGGNVVGEGAFIGINSSSIDKLRIGKWSVVGGGTTIIRDVPSDTIVAGNPHRILRKRDKTSPIFNS